MKPDEQMKERIGDEVASHVATHVATKIAKTVAAIVGGVFLVVFLGFFLGWVIQFLWNHTLVDMFDWPAISYWQAIGIFLLAKIFFGFGHSGGGSKNKGKKSDEKEKERVRQWWGRRMGMTYEHESPLTQDEMFKKYWQEEGKAAYDAYAAAQKDDSQTNPNP